MITVVSVPEEEQRRRVAACFARSGLTVEQLWLRYFALGGDASQLELDGFLQGLMMLPRMQRNVVAHAVNERLDELTGRRTAPYCATVDESTRPRGPLAALAELLDGVRRAPPERLPDVIAAAGRSLDLELAVYLADYDQRLLLPLPGAGGPDRLPLDLETSTAGRAYQEAGSVLAEDAAGPRLWTTLLDGEERMGVLEFIPGDGADLHDPALREHCRLIASLSGHLVAIATRYGDGLDMVRRRQRRGPVAELLWQNLPPLTATTDSVTVTGGLEPAYDVHSVTFDYALSESKAWLAIFDAGRNAPRASLAVSAVLAAYRSARRDGLALDGQESAVDRVLSAQFDGETPVHGTMAELDLTDGRLRYLETGRSAPLVVNENRELTTLDGGRRSPFGVGSPANIATVRLRPGDLLVLRTEGVAGARSAEGERFGLFECLRRNVGRIPPEAGRRVLRALTSHCGGEFRNDAGILLARWSGPR